MNVLNGKNIVVCVSGGIAAYKAVTLCSMLVKAQAEVYVVMTRHAVEFVSPLTFKTITKHKVTVGMFDDQQFIPHISLSDLADLVVVAPATANIIAKAANGICDDMTSTLLVSTECPKLIVPAMNTKMYNNPITQSNMQKLISVGYHFIEPDVGRMACGSVGAGRYPENDRIFAEIEAVLTPKDFFAGKNVLITLGGTQEAIDPVRFIGNHSSGKMGFAFAACFYKRHANVTVIAGSTDSLAKKTFLTKYPAIKLINVSSAADMHNAVSEHMPNNDILLKCAAVADYTPHYSEHKIKKSDNDLTLTLSRTTDILASLPKSQDKIYIGFSAETENVIENAKAKLKHKGVDFVIANEVAGAKSAMGGDRSQLYLIDKSCNVTPIEYGDKSDNADKVLDLIASYYK